MASESQEQMHEFRQAVTGRHQLDIIGSTLLSCGTVSAGAGLAGICLPFVDQKNLGSTVNTIGVVARGF